MLQATETRELIGVRLRGTFHRPAESAADPRTVGSGQARTAVLFLNSLALPRAASGDSAVYWAESFAKRGYPAFRFDLPGLGDSDGETSTDLLDFINAGGYAAAAAHLAKGLWPAAIFPEWSSWATARAQSPQCLLPLPAKSARASSSWTRTFIFPWPRDLRFARS